MEGPEKPPGGELAPWQSGQHAPKARRWRPASWRGAAGMGIAGAALLLYVFLLFDREARWWVPLAAGFVTLVLLALLRLDRLLKGWTWHVAGLALLAGLIYETAGNPWAWGFAAGIGVFVAGLLRLPRWELVAVGAAVCGVCAVGYQFRAADVRQQEAQVAQQAGEQLRSGFGYDRPDLVLAKLNEGLAGRDAQALCRLLDAPAEAQFAQAAGVPDCTAAVAVAAARIPAGASTTVPRPTAVGAPVPPPGAVVPLDGCATAWGAALPAVGTVDAVRTDNAARATWRVAGFRPC